MSFKKQNLSKLALANINAGGFLYEYTWDDSTGCVSGKYDANDGPIEFNIIKEDTSPNATCVGRRYKHPITGVISCWPTTIECN